jgi:hypothetical protein
VHDDRPGPQTGLTPEPAGPQPRPPDVDTGLWLWLAALPLLITAYVVDLLNPPVALRPWYVDAISGLFVLSLSAVVVTFLLLMRQGYRWARTLLTGGGLTSVLYVVTNLVSVDRPATAAVVYAISAIVGSVLIVGGMYLLHRKDVLEFFTR